jgi:hypothetical protein
VSTCSLEAKITQSWMIIGTTAKRPKIFAIRFLDGEIVDACESQPHQAIVVEFPILVAIGAIPVSRIIVPLVGKAYGNTVVRKSPKLFDQAVVEYHLRARKVMISCLPFTNSERFLQRESRE